MKNASAGASASTRPFHLMAQIIVTWAEQQPGHQELQAEVERLKKERRR